MPTRPLTPLLAVKALGEAKGRLAPLLSPIERRLLVTAMLEDVVAAVIATEGLGLPVLVSPDREIWRRADAIGCRVVEEPPGAEGGLNASLQRAAAVADGPGILVVGADLPLATPAALRLVVEAAGTGPVVVVPSRDGIGTNVAAWADAATFRPAFGEASAARHLAIPGAVKLENPELALDIDTPQDLLDVLPLLDPATVTGRRAGVLKLAARLGGPRPTV